MRSLLKIPIEKTSIDRIQIDKKPWMAVFLPALLIASCSKGGQECEGADCVESPVTASDTCLPEGAGDFTDADQFEYIIVGAGAGGGPLAANLARAGHSVLLLEAGEDPCNLLTNQVPAWHALASEDPEMAWFYFVDHYSDPTQAGRDSKYTPEGILYPRGTGIGGSTSVNAMITVTPHDSDWNRLAEMTGDTSWHSQNMKGYFDRVRDWLRVERADPFLAINDEKLLEIVLAAGVTFDRSYTPATLLGELFGLLSRDLTQSPAKQGLYNVPLATDGGRRGGVRDYLIQTVLDGHPLTIKTGAFVTNLTFAAGPDPDGKARVTGVEFIEGKNLYRASLKAPDTPGPRRSVAAMREVIVSAGAYNTPQILKLSGIGPADELAALGIEVRVALPGVGENLQDRYEVGIVHETRRDFDLIRNCTFGEGNDPCLQSWNQGRGVYTSNGSTVAIVKKSSPDLDEPDLFIFGTPADFRGYYPGYSRDGIADKNEFTWIILKGHTENRAGSVTLKSADPRDTPIVNFRYFHEGSTDQGQDQHDLDAVVTAVEFVRDIAQKTRDIQFLFPYFKEIWPGNAVDERHEIEQFIKDEAWGHHACCTNKIGGDDDPMAVLDSRFRVRGTTGLRVVDASVFPEIPGFFIAAPIYMISEKAADVILEDVSRQ
ncbi:MAG: GMC family oxidoreductase N-terminal domain-containing protein [Proteobacteria bacterium]|nr:GMC family oxidoreductase N-terminal domain-containing protein [Pseudomonadota bacterium]